MASSNAPAIARPSAAPAPASPRSRPHGPRPSALPVAQRRQHLRSPSAPSTIASAGVARAQSLSTGPTQPRVARAERRPRPLSEVREANDASPLQVPPRSTSSGALSGLRSLIRSSSRSRKTSSATDKVDVDKSKAESAEVEPAKSMWRRVRTLSQSSGRPVKPPRHAASSPVSLPISEKADASQPQTKPRPPSGKNDAAPNPLTAAGVLPSLLPAPRSAGQARSLALAQAKKASLPAPQPTVSSNGEDASSRPSPALDEQNIIRFPIAAAPVPPPETVLPDSVAPEPAVPTSSTPPTASKPFTSSPRTSTSLPNGGGSSVSPTSPALPTGLRPGQFVPSGGNTLGIITSSDTSPSGQPLGGGPPTDSGEGYAISPNVADDQTPYSSMRQRSLVSPNLSTPRLSVRSLPAPPRALRGGTAGSTSGDTSSANPSPKSRASLEPVAEGRRADARSSLVPLRPSAEGMQSSSPPPPYSIRTISAASSHMREQRSDPAPGTEPTTPTTPTVLVHPPVPSGNGSRSGSRLTNASFRTAQTAPSPVLLSPPASAGLTPRLMECGSSGSSGARSAGETGTAQDARSVAGLENTIQAREEDISIAEIETNLSIVEAALAEHDVEGSFDVSLLRPLSAPLQELSSGSQTSPRTSNLGPSPLSDDRRRALNPGSSQALTQAVWAVRQALGPTSPPQPGVNVRRDVEEAYARMLALVAQATEEPIAPATPLALSPASEGKGQVGDKTNGSAADRTDPMVAAPTLPHAGSSERFFASGGGAQDRTRAVAAWANFSAHPEVEEDDPPRRRFTSDPRRRALPDPLPSASTEKLAERHRLETESLLDALERAEATAREARKETITLRTDLRLEVARVLQLERALTQAQTRTEEAETKLERAQDQLRLEREARVGLMHQLEQLTATWPRSGSESTSLTALPAEKRSSELLPTSLSTDTAARFLSPVEDERESRSSSPLLETQMPDIPTVDDADLPPPSSPPALGRSTRRKPPVSIPRGHLRTASGTSLRKVSNSTGESSFTARTPSSVGGYVYDRLGRGYYNPDRPAGYSALDMPSLHREIFDSSVDEAF